MNKKEIELKIISIIDRIKPFIISDGGNIEFVKYVDNIVYVKLDGACKDCMKSFMFLGTYTYTYNGN